MAQFNPGRIRNPRQLASRMSGMDRINQIATMGHRGGGGGPSYGAPGQQRFGGPVAPHGPGAGLAESADDRIRSQGGSLAPSYGPSGLNDLYSRQPSQWQRMQDIAQRAQSGDAEGANTLEKAQQASDFGFKSDSQRLRDAVNARDKIGQVGQKTDTPDLSQRDVFGNIPKDAQVSGATEAGSNALQNFADQQQAARAPSQNDETQAEGADDTPDPFAGTAPFQFGTSYGDESVPAAAHGARLKGNLATIAEKGSEHKFNDDGSIEQFRSPTLLQNPKPGIVVPDHKLHAFLKKFAHPPKDESLVKLPEGEDETGAYDAGGIMGPTWGGANPQTLARIQGAATGGILGTGWNSTEPLRGADPESGEIYGPEEDTGVDYGPATESPEQLALERNEYAPAPSYITGLHALPAAPTKRNPQSWELPQNSPQAMFNAGREAVLNHKILYGAEPGDPDMAYLPRDTNGIHRGILEMPVNGPSAYGAQTAPTTGGTGNLINGVPAQEWFQEMANHFGDEGGPNKFANPEPGYHGDKSLWAPRTRKALKKFV